MAHEDSGNEVLVNNPGSWPAPEGRIGDACRLVLDLEGIKDAEVSVTLLADSEIQELNREYFQKEYLAGNLIHDKYFPGYGNQNL